MRKAEIQVGTTYRNYAGQTRTVLSDADSRNPHQQDDDLVSYRDATGRESICTKRHFARWAKAVVVEPTNTPAAA